MARKKTKRSDYDLDLLRSAAVGQWDRILASTGQLTSDQLRRQGPCLKCGGKDRFGPFDDFHETGGISCRKCFDRKNSDGFAALQWLTGCDFQDAMAFVANYLGIKPDGKGGTRKQRKVQPDEHLVFEDWRPVLAEEWCAKKPGITPDALLAAGAQVARYRDQFTVFAFPIWGPKLKTDKPVGYVCVNSTGLGLPVWQKGSDPVWVDKKTMPGSGRGIIGDPDAIQAAGREWKLEGLTDLLTFLSMPVGEGHAAFTTAMGCQEHPDEAKWICKLFEGKIGAVLHDADTPGQRGALGWDKGGERRPGWAERIAGYATECRNVLLPYQVAETHGKDFRDFVAEGGTFNQLVELFEKAEAILPTEEHANEKDDDYTRLARVNLKRVKAMGGGIVFWGGSSYTYKEGQYRHQERDYLKSKLWTGVKFEMDRLYYEDKAAFDEQKDPDAEPPVAKNVTPNMIKGVYEATAAMTRIAAGTELNTWLPTGEKRAYISMQNGILDVDAVMTGKLDKCLLPHSPDWFSTTKFNYRFDPNAGCPKWLEFLEHNLEGDWQRINLLQEWMGYLLVADSSKHKFLLLEGEGSNGKSVFVAGVQAVLGAKNCSYLPLEQFDDKYLRSSTLGKMCNISTDAGEVDRTAEGMIKAFVAGDHMTFDRKYLTPIECAPTAKLMIACNTKPNFRDRTSGIWRRMIPMPWRVEITADMRIDGMDSWEWWTRQGEVPGMLNWALAGLFRLRHQGAFTQSDVVDEALEEYRLDSNSAKRFLTENLEEATGRPGIKCNNLFQMYRKWADEHGSRGTVGSIEFGKEVRRVFRHVEKKRRGAKQKRINAYFGIDFREGAFLPEELLGVYLDDFDD